MANTNTILSDAIRTSIRQDRNVRVPHTSGLEIQVGMRCEDSTLWTDSEDGGEYREYWGADDAGSPWAVTLVRG